MEKIRTSAQDALTLLTDIENQRVLAWKCTGCGHVKHFTKPVPVDVISRCPRYKSEQFASLT